MRKIVRYIKKRDFQKQDFSELKETTLNPTKYVIPNSLKG